MSSINPINTGLDRIEGISDLPQVAASQEKISQTFARFQADQVLKRIKQFPCTTEQTPELVDTSVKHLKSQMDT